MVGQPGRFGASGQFLEAPEVLAIERLGRAEVHGDTVLDDPVLLRDDLEPIDNRSLREDMVVMRYAQSDADTVVIERIKAIGWHWNSVSQQGNRLEARGCHKPPP